MFVNCVRYYREKKGLSQAQLADAVGVSKSHITKIEVHENAASAMVMQNIANALEIDVSELYKAEPTEKPQPSENESRAAFGMAIHFIGKAFTEYDKCNDSDKRTFRAFIKTMIEESK